MITVKRRAVISDGLVSNRMSTLSEPSGGIQVKGDSNTHSRLPCETMTFRTLAEGVVGGGRVSQFLSYLMLNAQSTVKSC